MKIGSTNISDIKVGSTQISKVYKDGVVYWGSLPSMSDALFWLDGEILDVSGTKYFKDQTINNRNFLITNYDFDSTWVRGFPYKSAATISAPVGDATLIAADVNNYLYTAGTPNQIPVISLFQNIDYKNKLFARHVSQVLDGNGVETYEPRVLDIVLYNTTKTGQGLTDCNTYYGVPVIDATAKWIDPVNGNDTTGTGTQLLPYKTHSKVNGLTLTEGIQVYCLTGALVVNIAWSKNYNLKTIGLTKISVGSSTRGIDYDPAGTLGQTISGYFIDKLNGSLGVNFNGNAILHALTLDKFHLINSAASAIQSVTYAAQTLNVTNSNFNSAVNGIYANKNLNIDNCTFKNISAYLIYKDNASKNTITVNHSKLNGIVPFRTYGLIDLNILDSELAWNGSTLFSANTTTVGDFVFKNTTLNYTGSAVTGLMNPEGMRLTKLEFDGCTFTSAVRNSIPFWNINGSVIFKNNISYSTTTNSISYFIDHNIDGLTTTVTFENNLIRHDNIINPILTIGGDPESYKNRIGGTARKNKFIHLNDQTAHGFIVLNQNTGTLVNWNYFWGPPANGFKSTDGDDYSACVWSYNVHRQAFILAKGVKNSHIYNNTVVIPTYSPYSFDLVAVEGNFASTSTGNKVKNNIIVYLGTEPMGMIRNDNVDNEYDYNLYYCPNTPMYFRHLNVNKTWAEWQALGYDPNSRVLTDEEYAGLFTDPDNGDFTLKAGSIAIGAGVDLGGSYDDGLDSSTNWSSNSAIPTVVTKTQSGSWDVGAYIH